MGCRCVRAGGVAFDWFVLFFSSLLSILFYVIPQRGNSLRRSSDQRHKRSGTRRLAPRMALTIAEHIWGERQGEREEGEGRRGDGDMGQFEISNKDAFLTGQTVHPRYFVCFYWATRRSQNLSERQNEACNAIFRETKWRQRRGCNELAIYRRWTPIDGNGWQPYGATLLQPFQIAKG